MTSSSPAPGHLGEPPSGGAGSPSAGEGLLTFPDAARALLVTQPVLAKLVVRGRLGETVVNSDGQACLRKAAILDYKARRRERREEGLRRVDELSRRMGLDEELSPQRLPDSPRGGST